MVPGLYCRRKLRTALAAAALLLLPGAATYAQDVTAPEGLSSLSAAPAAPVGALTLYWSAPGDDGGSGSLAAGSTFYVQYSTYAGAAWSAAAAQVVQSTSGVTPAAQVSYVVGGMDPGTTYYLAVWHRDEAGNLSAVSNIASAYARPFPPPPVNRTVNGDGTWHIALPVVSNAFTTGLAADATGNIYVAGIMHSGVNEDIFLHKYDASGNLLLAKYYNGEENFPDSAYPAVAVDTVTGAFYLAGHEFGTYPDAVGLLIKYDASGQMVWKRTAQGNSATNGQGLLAVVLDGAGDVYVGGQLSNGSVNDSFVRKYTSSGGMVWSSTLAFSPSYDWVTSLALRDGYVYAAGSADMAYLGQGQNATLWKLDTTTGLTAWTTYYNSVSSRHDDASGVAADASGHVYLVGNSQVSGSDYAMLLQKRSAATGAIEWTSARNYAAGVQDSYVEIRAEADGSVYVGGTTGLGVNGNVVISKYDASGNLLGEYTYDVDGGEDVLDNLIISGGKVIVSGSETYGGQKRHFVRQVNQSALVLPDTLPPTQAVLQPANGSYVNSLAAISGTAADNVGVSSVTVSLKRLSDNLYWSGAAWGASQAWLNASLWPSSWTYTALPAWTNGASYAVTARAADTSNNWSTVYSTSVFYYDNGRPSSAVSVPAAGSVVTSFAGLAGTAADAELQVAQVWVKVSRISDGKYWDGAAWTAAETWKTAAGTSAWSYSGLPASALDSGTTYYAVSRAADLAGNMQVSEAQVSTFSYLVQQFGPAPFAGVGASSLTVNWATNFYGGTTYYLRLSTAPSEYQYSVSAATTSQSLAFNGLIPNTTYYAYVATAPAGGYVQVAVGVTRMETPVDIYFDEIEATRIVASAYAPTPAFHNLNLGQSGTNVAISSAGWTWAGWHGEKWTARAPMPVPRRYFGVASAGTKLYLVGGDNAGGNLTRTDEYDAVLDTWVEKAPMPTPRMGLSAAMSGGRLYAVGGVGDDNLVTRTNEEYSPAENVWRIKAPAAHALFAFGLAAVGDRLFSIGSDSFESHTAAYIPSFDSWTVLTGMATRRGELGLGTVNGKIYAMGGNAGDSLWLTTNEGYDPVTDRWENKAPMPYPRKLFGVGMIGGKFYAVGGLNQGGGDMLNAEYDPAVDVWTVREDIPLARHALGVGVSGGRLYALGGDHYGFLANNDEYDPGVAGVFTGLLPNTLYSFKAKARNQAGVETGESVIVSTYTLALPPGSVSVAAVSSRAVSVSWDRGANPPGTMFEVSYSTVSSLSLACAGCVAALTEDASLLYTGLAPSTTYYFRVLTFNVLGAPTRATAAAPVLTLPPPPGAITLSGSAVGVSSITWAWNAVPDAEGYRVAASSGGDVSGGLSPTIHSWIESGLSVNTQYTRRVQADNVSGFSLSQETSRYTLAAVPGAPTVTGRSDTVLELDWASGGNPEPGTLYQLLRSTSSDFSPAVISTVAVSSTAVSGLQPDRLYHFKVRAVNGDGLFSAFSAAVSTATMPPLPVAPPAPAGQALGISSITWSWAASPAAEYYRVYAGSVLLASPATTYYTRSGLAPNTTYSITVSGVNELGEGAASPAAAPLSTLAMPPLGAGISAVYITSATMSWGLGGNPLGTSARVQRLEPAAVFSTQGTAYTDTGLLACTTYYFRVWNVNRDGLATPYSAIGPVFTGVTPPPPPSNLSAVSLAVSRIYLSWDPSPSEGITAYNLYFDDGTGVINYSSPLATVPAGQNGYTTGVLTSSAAYKFGLRALHRCGVEEKNTTVIAAAPSMYSLTGVRAAIKIPQTGKRVNGNSVTVMAEQVTGAADELKNVRFQYKAAADSAWLNIPAKDPAAHPNPDPSSPYFIHWDVSALAPGMYNLRAVASDFGNTADPTPAYITITVDPVEAEIVENASGGKVTKEQLVNNLVTNVLQAGDPEKPQVTRLEIPAGALDASTATVAVTNNPAVLPPEPADATAAGVSVEVSLSGQSALAGGQSAVVTLMFPDSDGDGTVDGTNIRANQLQMYSAHSAAGPWQRDLASEVDLVNRKVTGHTTHFSFFALFAPQASGISSARAYPVPWRPGSGGRFDSAPGSDGITFDNLTDDSVIYVYTITGQLVRELRLSAADLGVKVWDGRNSDGRKAASGVYLARIKSGSGTRTLKIVVER